MLKSAHTNSDRQRHLWIGLFALITLLLGQVVSSGHVAAYGGHSHAHVYHDHASSGRFADEGPAKPAEIDRLCDLAVFAHGTALTADDVAVLTVAAIVVVETITVPDSMPVRTIQFAMPPGRGPPNHSTI